MIFNIDKFFHKEKLNTVLKSKNVIPMNGTVYDEENTGLKSYLNNDGSLFLNGTATKDTRITFWYDSLSTGLSYFEVGKTYKIVCNGESDQARCSIMAGGNTVTYHAGDTFTATNNITLIDFYYYVKAGDTFDNFTFYPMICLSTYTGDWVSYNANNKVLTQAVKELKDSNASIVEILNKTVSIPIKAAATHTVDATITDTYLINQGYKVIFVGFILTNGVQYFTEMRTTPFKGAKWVEDLSDMILVGFTSSGFTVQTVTNTASNVTIANIRIFGIK